MALALAGCAVTPNAVSDAHLAQHAETQKAKLGLAVETDPVSGPIDLYEAMARALKHNLRHRVAAMEAALAAGGTKLARYDMLPTVAAQAGFNGRNNYTGSYSRPLLTSDTAGPRGATADTSQELEHATANLTLSWNILDFGLSYVRAKQAADKQLIARENQRKAAN
ncbi:MAG: TolC family protein, partial [Pseudomonadota bacterium]